jgi:hypothetical protein
VIIVVYGVKTVVNGHRANDREDPVQPPGLT